MRRYVSFLLMFASLALLVTSPAHAARRLTNIPLDWRPTDELAEYDPVDLTPFYDVTLQVLPLEDHREGDRSLIAENQPTRVPGDFRPAISAPRT